MDIKRLLRMGARKFPPLALVDRWRRLAYESVYFDFLTRPLARRLEEWPRKLIIDTTNHCNAKCLWCVNPTMEAPRGVMGARLYQKIVDDYAARGGKLWLGTFGEPFLDKNIVDRCLYAAQKDTIQEVTLLSNGSLIREDQARRLIDNGVNLEFSLDEIDPETFERIKKVDFKTTWGNILKCLEINRDKGDRVKVKVRMKTSMNESDVRKDPKYHILEKLATNVDLAPISTSDAIGNWSGSFEKERFFEEFFKGGVAEGRYKSYNKTNKAPCSQLWASMTVNWDGRVALCCADITASEIMGDLNHEAIEDVWRGEKFQETRKVALSRERSKLPLCSVCDQHQGWRYLSFVDRL